MNNSLKFTIETQTENKEIIAVCHMNEKAIALQSSEEAKKLFKNNKDLFNRINSSTKILSGRLIRIEETKKENSLNKLNVKIDGSYQHNEEEICKFKFTNTFLKKQQRIENLSGKLFDIDPANLDVNKNMTSFDGNSITVDDYNESRIIAEVEELFLFQFDGIRTFLIKDNAHTKPGLKRVSYKISFDIETKFKEYISFVVNEIQSSIMFLEKYHNTLSLNSRYDRIERKFTSSFKDSIYEQLGLSSLNINSNLGSNIIKDSDFGKVGLNFYNGSLLLSENVEKNVYGKVLKSIIPSELTSPEKIYKVLESLINLHKRILQSYDLESNKFQGNKRSQKIHFRSKQSLNRIEAHTTAIRIDQEALGYNVFSENQVGMSNFSASSYRERFLQEQMKYYPSIEVDDATGFMTQEEKINFSRVDNAPSFLTPANLVMKNKKISTARGLNNIDIEDIRQFRIVKATKASQVLRTSIDTPSKETGISRNVMSDFNLTVGTPKTSLLERSVDQDIDPMVDAKHYVGESSYFVTNNPFKVLKRFKNIESKEDERILEIVSDVIPARFLKQNSDIKSIKDIQFSNKKSKIRSLVSKKMINLSEIPPQIKSMMSQTFAINPTIDPLQNKESRAIIDETQKNIFMVKALVGFEMGEDGFFDLYRPIYEEISKVDIGLTPVLAKAYDYEVPQLGIVKDKYVPTIYNNLLYIRGENERVL